MVDAFFAVMDGGPTPPDLHGTVTVDELAGFVSAEVKPSWLPLGIIVLRQVR
jgi:hypothetical protein